MKGIDNNVYIDTQSRAALDLRQGGSMQEQMTSGPEELAPADLDDHRAPGAVTRPSTNRIRIAISDAQSIFRDGLRKLLGEELDFDIVTEASSPSLLLSSFSVTSPDVALISISSDIGAGLDVFATMQTSYPDIKVIVLSSGNDQDEFVRNIRLGARGIVQKSTSGPMLIKAIRKVQDGEFWLDRSTTAEVVRHFTERKADTVAEPRQIEGRLPSLSRREREIVNLVTHGLRNKELAERLSISEQTVKNHMHNIFDKLGVSDRLELALYAIHHNWHESF